MATESEELKLVVTLDDQASAQLASLRQQLASMSAGVGQAGTNIGAKSNEAAKAVKGLHTELSSVAGRAGFIGGVIGGITSELTKLGISVIQRASDLEGLSRSMVKMGQAATEMGASSAQLRQNVQAFREVGVSAEAAEKNLAGFSDAMADLTLINGRLRSELLTGGFLDLQKMQQTLAKSDVAKTVQEQAGIWRHAAHEVREYWTQLAGPQEGARRERQFLQAIGAPDLARLRRELEGVAGWQKALFDERDKAAAKYLEVSEQTSYAYTRIAESAGAILIDLANATGASKLWKDAVTGVADQLERSHYLMLMPADKRAAEYQKGLTEKGKELSKGVEGDTPETYGQQRFNIIMNRIFEAIYGENWKGAPGANTPQRFGGGGLGPYSPKTGGLNDFLSGSPESTNIEDRRGETEDNTESLQDLTAQLKELNANIAYGFLDTQMGGLAPGLGRGGGRAGGAGAGGGMGALPGMGPGGYNPGGGTGPGNQSGTPGTNTGGTPGAASPAWPDPSKGNVIPPGFGQESGGIGGVEGIRGASPWAQTVRGPGGGAFSGEAVKTPPGWGPGGSGQPWGTQGGGQQQGGGGGNDLSREAYDQMFKGTPLAGQYDNVVKAAQANNVPPSAMAAVIAHETGKGTSAMVRNNLNPAGLMDPKTNWQTGQKFATIEEGIESAGRTIGKHYANAGGDFNKMGSVYAPQGAKNDPGGLNKYWPSGVATHQKQLQSKEASLGPPGTSGVGPGAGAGGGSPQGDIRLTGGSQGINPQLYDIVREASRSLPEGYSAALRSGVGSRPGGSSSYHPHGLAADIEIIGPDGKPIGDRSGVKGWYQDPKSFRAYEQFAQAAKTVQSQKYPNSPGFAWGGYFLNKGPGSYGFADSMHMQLGGPMGGGSWEGGAQGVTREWLERGGGTSAGMGRGGPSGFAAGGSGRGGGSGAVANALDWSTGRQLDKRQAVDVNGTGKIDVSVSAPNGTSVKAEGGGLFKKTEITRSTQMAPAEKGPTHSANADEE